MRKRTDQLYFRSLGPGEREALSLIEKRPGITVAELADALGVGMPVRGGFLVGWRRAVCGASGERESPAERPERPWEGRRPVGGAGVRCP